jgi:hypothetical protein
MLVEVEVEHTTEAQEALVDQVVVALVLLVA